MFRCAEVQQLLDTDGTGINPRTTRNPQPWGFNEQRFEQTVTHWDFQLGQPIQRALVIDHLPRTVGFVGHADAVDQIGRAHV